MRPYAQPLLVATALILVRTLSAEPMAESVMKARHLLGFAEFVEWPDGAFAEKKAPLIVGVVGDDLVFEQLRREEVRRVVGRNVSIRSFAWEELTDRRARIEEQLRACHILFVGQSESRVMPLILSKIKGASVLTVGDAVSFTRTGGVIGFFRVPGELLVEVNLEAAQAANLKISSQLLRLVKVIYPGEGQPRSSK
jgi:hypothetical protein